MALSLLARLLTIEPTSNKTKGKRMYTHTNYRTKAALKRDVAAGKQVTVFQPNADLTGFPTRHDGTVCLEGPHYPEPHRWYAEAQIKDGVIVSVK